MCFYNTFSYSCGCESHPPTLTYPCASSRTRPPCCYHPCDHHHCAQKGCPLFFVDHERTTPGKCASHRAEAQIEKKIQGLKDEVRLLKEDIAEYQDQIAQEKRGRRARNQGMRG